MTGNSEESQDNPSLSFLLLPTEDPQEAELVESPRFLYFTANVTPVEVVKKLL